MQIKLKKLDLESATFSVGEIACVFAGRFDLFVYSFGGKAKSNEHDQLSISNYGAEVAASSEASTATVTGILVTEGAGTIPNYAARQERAQTIGAAIPNTEI